MLIIVNTRVIIITRQRFFKSKTAKKAVFLFYFQNLKPWALAHRDSLFRLMALTALLTFQRFPAIFLL